MDEILIHLPLLTEDGEYKFWLTSKNITSRLHFTPSASGPEMKLWFYVVDDMRNAYIKFVRSGVKLIFRNT